MLSVFEESSFLVRFGKTVMRPCSGSSSPLFLDC